LDNDGQKEIKMKNKLFDDFVQKQFDGYKPEVGAHIWENIARQREKQKPVGFWFSTFGKVAATFLVMLSSIAVGYYFMHNKNTTPKEISVNNVNKEKSTSPTIKVLQENNATTMNGNKKDIPTAEPIQLNEKAKPTSTNTTNKIAVISKNGKNNTSSSILKPTDANDIANKIRNDKYLNGNTAVNISKNDEDNINNMLVPSITTTDLINQNRLFVPTVNTKKMPKIAFVPCPEAEENAAGNKKYIEVYGGPDYIFKTYADTGEAYIAQRKASTGIHYAFSAGVRYTKVFGSGISVRTGVNYSQINERFIAFNGFVLERFVQVNSLGDTIANYTTATVQYKKSNNIYRAIDIPIQAGFEFGNGRWHTNLSAGALINIRSKQTGYAVEPNGKVIDLSSAKASSKYQYKSNVGVSFLGSASVYYKLNEKLHLMAEPYIRYSLSPMTKSEITFSQKFHTAGLRLGLRWDL
jgi:hypothetical protein